MDSVRRPGERGQSLVIVLSLITLFFLLGSALAVHASVALRATRAAEGQGDDFYAADAATELGIWWQRAGKPGNPPAQTINGTTTSTTITTSGGGGGSCPADPKPIWMTGIESGFTAMNIPVQQAAETSTPLINWAYGGGDVTIVNSPVRTGANALRIHPLAYPGTGAYRSVDKNTGNFIASTLVIRFSVRLATIPTGDADIAQFGYNGGNYLTIFYRASTGKWAMTYAAALVHSFTGTIVEGPSVAAGQWYNFDLRLVAANPRTAEWQVDGTAYPTASSSEAATAGIMLWYLGHANGDNADITMYFDDMMASGTSADYPLGDVKIEPLLPNGMGTHNTPANYQNNDSTALNATSYQRVDEIPQTALTDYIKQITAGAATYAELTFQDTTQTCIRGASIAFAVHSASATANNVAVNAVTNGFNFNMFTGDPSETTLLYQQSVVTQNAGAPGTGPWTQAIINGITARFGMSTDVSPNPYLDAILLENAYRPIVAGPATITIVGTGGGSTVSAGYPDAGAAAPTLSTWTTTK
jgi:Tfp pilus assembly protein PilX